MTRIRRMTVTLPPRLRHLAEHEARRIAREAAAQLGDDAPRRLSVTVEGRGTSGHGLAAAVGRSLATSTKGRG